MISRGNLKLPLKTLLDIAYGIVVSISKMVVVMQVLIYSHTSIYKLVPYKSILTPSAPQDEITIR